MTRVRCPQCYRTKAWPKAFVSPSTGRVIKKCARCAKKYRGWSKKTWAQKQPKPKRPRLLTQGTTDTWYRWYAVSKNRKLGAMPSTMSAPESCPTTCPWYGDGCYAEHGTTVVHWAKTRQGGLDVYELCEKIKALPPGTVWRHNVAGDLSSLTELGLLDLANSGRRGFTFTHHRWMLKYQFRMLFDHCLTVNISCDTVEEADAMRKLGWPTALVVPTDSPRRFRTPAGHHVIACPNETHGITCQECQLCTKRWRKSIIAFRAHGQMKERINEKLVQIGRKPA